MVGTPDFGEVGVVFILGPQCQSPIIKMVPDHVCGRGNRTKDLIRNFIAKMLSKLDNGLSYLHRLLHLKMWIIRTMKVPSTLLS